MTIRAVVIIFFSFCFLETIAQSTGTLSGTISHSSGAAVEGASVRLLNTTFGTSTDQQGNFRITDVPSGTYTVQVSSIGYAGITTEVNIQEGQEENIQLTIRESTTQLDVVVVTAQKVEEDIRKVPVSVTALSQEEVQRYRLWNTNSLTAIVPGLYTSHSGDNRNVTSIRGIATTSYDPAVTTYIDGVNQFSLDTYIAQLFDIERIEVLRGPQGTLYGRNAMGGVINIITREPSNRKEGFLEASIGTYGQQRYGGAFRTPVVNDKLYAGLSFLYDRTNGFYTNLFNDTDFDQKRSFMGSYFIKYKPAANWSVTANMKHVANRNKGAFPLASSPDEAFANPFTVNQNAATELVDDIYNGSLTVQHTGRTFNFTSISSYQSNLRYYKTPIDADFSPLDIVTIINNYGRDWNNVKVLTQEFKFTSRPTSGAAQWTGGMYAFRQRNPVKQTTHFGENGDIYGAPPMSFTTNTATGNNTGIAFYGQLTYPILERLYLTGGLRYDYEKREQDIVGEFGFDPDPGFPIADTAAHVSYQALSPKVSLSYDFSDTKTVYATYSRGFRTGGLTPFTGDPAQPPLYGFDPEYSNNIELGFKHAYLNNRLTAHLTLFYTTVSDVQIPTLVLPEAITITRNAGSMTTKGIELEVAATPTRGLHLQYNLGYNHARYNSSSYYFQDEVINLEGNHQLFTPDVTSMLAAQYDVDVTSMLRLFARAEWTYVGVNYFNLANTIRQAPYQLLHTRVGVASKQFEFAVWVRNLTDTKYIAYAYDFGATHLGEPRNIGATLRVYFAH